MISFLECVSRRDLTERNVVAGLAEEAAQRLREAAVERCVELQRAELDAGAEGHLERRGGDLLRTGRADVLDFQLRVGRLRRAEAQRQPIVVPRVTCLAQSLHYNQPHGTAVIYNQYFHGYLLVVGDSHNSDYFCAAIDPVYCSLLGINQ